MKQLTYIKKNTLEWWDIKEPNLETAQDVIVRPLAAARCLCPIMLYFYFEMRLSISKYFSSIKLNANAPADALKTEKSRAPFIPVEKVIDRPKASNRNALSFAKNSVFNPMSKKNASNISAPVAIAPTIEIRPLGNHGLISRV